MQYDKLNLDHAKVLVDVVLGVILGISISYFPIIIRYHPPDVISSILLMFGSLLFSVFYWIEIRYSIDDQSLFNSIISKYSQYSISAFLPLSPFLVGSIVMALMFSNILYFSAHGDIMHVFIYNTIFWTLDITGTVIIKYEYYKFKALLNNIIDDYLQAKLWYLKHVLSNYYIYYGIINITIYLLFIVILSVYKYNATKIMLSVLYIIHQFARHRLVIKHLSTPHSSAK